MKKTQIVITMFFLITTMLFAQQDQEQSLWSEETFSGLTFRSIGPALMSGRIADIAIHPEN